MPQTQNKVEFVDKNSFMWNYLFLYLKCFRGTFSITFPPADNLYFYIMKKTLRILENKESENSVKIKKKSFQGFVKSFWENSNSKACYEKSWIWLNLPSRHWFPPSFLLFYYYFTIASSCMGKGHFSNAPLNFCKKEYGRTPPPDLDEKGSVYKVSDYECWKRPLVNRPLSSMCRL